MNHTSKSINPFPGLRAFRQDEDYLFFGREEQTIELLRRLGGNRFVTVVGTSGSGKSSLVRCGLLSELLGGRMLQAGASWEVAVTHPGGNPLAILTDALLDADLYDREVENTRENLLATLSRSHFGLVEAVRQAGIGKDTNFLLVVDQFEEIFRFRDAGETQQEAAAEFVSLLLQAVAQREVPVYVVLTMRSDFIGECSQFEGLSEMVNQGEFLIPRLTREQYKRVIEGPVKVAGGKIAPRLLQRLLNDLGQQADQLPCLQHALMRTWDVWSESGENRELDLEDYRRVGGMTEALSLHADEIYGALGSDQEREWCRGLFEALTVKESENRGIRRPQRLSSLCEIIEVTPAQLVPVIDAFRRQGVTFLMPSPDVDLTDSTIIDISHESLMRVWTRLRQWVEEEAQAAGIYVRLAESAMLHEEGKAGLYRDPELGIALAWIDRARHPNEAWAERYRHGYQEAMAFLAASKEAAEAGEREVEATRQRELAQAQALADAERLRADEQKKNARRLRKLLAVAAVIALVAIGASIFAAIQTGKAKQSEAATDALASQLKTSLVQGDFNNSFEKLNSGDAGASLAYLARAMRTNPAYAPAGMRAISTLTSGRLPVQRFAPIEHTKPISNYLFNKKHDLLLTSSEEGREVHLWEMETGRRRNPLKGATAEELRSRAAGPAPAAILAGIKDKFANSRRIWLASDPSEPPRDARYFRKTIPIPADRKPARADLFLMVDNSFELSVNGINAGAGNSYETTYHAGLLGPALEGGLDLFIVARNSERAAYVIGVVVITFEEGDPLVLTTDASWQSSGTEGTGFADSKDWEPATNAGTRIEELSAPSLDQFQWSADEDRLVARDAGTGQIVEWDVATGKRTGTPVNLKGMKNLVVSSFGEPGDLAGCSYTGDGAIQVWNLKTGEAATQRLKSGGNVVQWNFTPDGKRVVGLFSDAVIVVWDVAGGAEVARVRTRPVRPVGFLLSGDGRFLLTWDDSNKKVAWWEPGAAGGSGDLTWIDLPFASDDDRFLTSDNVVSFIGTGENNTVRARSYALTGDRKQLADITSSPNAVHMGRQGFRNAARNEPHGIVGAVNANAITLWDLRTGEAFPRPLIAPELLASANLSPDGRRLVAGSATEGTNTAAGAADKKLFVFDIFKASLAFPRPIVLQSSSRIQFSPDGETLITMDQEAKRTSFWDLRTGREARAPIAVAAAGLEFSRSGDRVALFEYSSVRRGTEALGQTTGRFFLHEVGLSPAAPEYLLERSQRVPYVFAPSAGGQWVTYDWPAASPTARLQVWDSQKTAAERTLDLDVDTKANNSGASSFSADGKRMILINREKAAVVLETGTGKTLAELSGDASVTVVEMSRDGSIAACGATDGSVKVWAADRGTASFKPFADQDSIDYLGLNGAGSVLAVSNATKKRLAVIDTRTGAPLFEPRQTVNISEDFAFTPDDRYVIVSQLDAKIPMIDLKTGEVVREFEIADWSRGVDLNAGGSILAVGSGANLSARSGVAYLFDVASGRMLTPPLPHAGMVQLVRFNLDGAILATGTFQTPTGFSYFQLWDVATGLPLIDPVAGRGQVISIAFQPDGSSAAASWTGGAVQTVAIPPKKAAPKWLPQLAEAVAGRRLAAETGTLENVPDEELAAIRAKVLAADSVLAADGEWFKWAKWLFESGESRTVSPVAKTTLARHIERLRASDNFDDLHEAIRLAPNDALTFARLATRYQSTTGNQGTMKGHWDDSAVWYSNRAIDLAPDSAEVWTLRGELMRNLGRTTLAAEAAAKVLALAPAGKDAASPNTLYQNAMALAAQGKWEEAQTAYDSALDLLDDYAKKVEAGQQPQPLPGNLGRLVPTRVAATKPDQPASPDAISKEPIPGAFENFDAVAPGRLPPGWRVWNQSDPGRRPGVNHASDFQADNWNDWTVIDRKQLDWGDDYLRRRVLMEDATSQKKIADGTAVHLLDGRFALAMSSTRPGEQIQYLESPDFDCSGRKDVRLAFSSAWEQHDERMGIVEYSLDRGTTWKPVVYFVFQRYVDDAKKKYADSRKGTETKGEFDVAAFLNANHNRFPWRPQAGGVTPRGSFGAFTVAADTPGLAACFEGRDASQTQYKRREIRSLPAADGAATVRVRFGSVSSGHSLWAVDSVGLYEGAAETEPVAVASGAETKKELKRPAHDATELVKLASEFAGGPRAADGEAPAATPLMAVAMAAMSQADAAPEAPKVTPGSGSNAAQPATIASKLLETRMLLTRARKLAPKNRELRVFAAMMEMAGLAALANDKEAVLKAADPFIGRAHDALLKSDDLAADLRDPVWRIGYSMIVAVRGMMAAQNGDREAALTLLALAEPIATGPAKQMIGPMLAYVEAGMPATPVLPVVTDSDILLKRGSTWSYFDEGKLPDPAWMQPEFDDSLWFRGPASLGYGDKPKTAVGWGPDATKRYITTYFRTRFDVADPAKIRGLVLRLLRDDGAVVYINGKEVRRDNMPKGDVDYGTLASKTVGDKDETRFFDQTVELVALNKGANVVAVEMHQAEAKSSDLGFDLEIAAVTAPRAVTASAIPVATFGGKFKAFGIPDMIQGEFWSFRAEQFIRSGDSAKATEALQQTEALRARDDNDPLTLRLRALLAAAGANAGEADRLYTSAMDGMLKETAAGKSVDLRPLPAALREAALVLRQTPADLAFVFRRLAGDSLPPSEMDLALNWAMKKAGSDPAALAQIWSGLTDGLSRHQEALAIAESVIPSLPKPKAGSSAGEVRHFNHWLSCRELSLRSVGNKAAADALRTELFAVPPRDPSLSPKLIDLSAYYQGNLYRGMSLSSLPESFVPLKGVTFDLRGVIRLESGALSDGKTYNEKYNSKHPVEVKGIKIGQKSPAIHFLTSTSWGRETRGAEVARLVIHYADGTSETMPVKFIDDVADSVTTSSDPVNAARVGWRGTNDSGELHELSELVWKNPHPDKMIQTLNFISAQAKAAPFLLGITLE